MSLVLPSGLGIDSEGRLCREAKQGFCKEGDLKAGATRTEARAQGVEETWCAGEDRFSVVTFPPPLQSAASIGLPPELICTVCWG